MYVLMSASLLTQSSRYLDKFLTQTFHINFKMVTFIGPLLYMYVTFRSNIFQHIVSFPSQIQCLVPQIAGP